MLPSIRTIWRRLGSCQSLWFSRSERGLRICLAATPVSAAIAYAVSAVATLTLGSSTRLFPCRVDCGRVSLRYSYPKQFWVLPSLLKWILKVTQVAYHSPPPFLFQIFLNAQCNCFIQFGKGSKRCDFFFKEEKGTEVDTLQWLLPLSWQRAFSIHCKKELLLAVILW